MISYISLTTIFLLKIQAFEFIEVPQENLVSPKDSFCLNSEKILNLFKHYQKLQRSYCNLPEEVDSQPEERSNFPENRYHLSKRLVRGCQCQSTDIYIDLGENYFPKKLKSLTCGRTACCDDAKLDCQEVKYTVQVLKTRKPQDWVDHSLHPLLSSNWKSESIDVVAACACLMRPEFS